MEKMIDKKTEMNENSTTEKGFKKLGYTKLESAEIVTALNQVLANMHIFRQKVKAYHWNITGDDFFDLHEQFEQLYDKLQVNIDEVAERVRVFGHFPTSKWSDYLKTATVEEHEEKTSSFQMVKNLRNDMELLIDSMISTTEAAIDAGDLGTQDMMNKMIRDTEKLHWMYSSYLA